MSMELTELAENIFNFKMDIETIKANIQSFLLANHYVKLADNQSSSFLPTEVQVKLGIDDLVPDELDIAFRRGYDQKHIDMLSAGWRKVKLEVKDGTED